MMYKCLLKTIVFVLSLQVLYAQDHVIQSPDAALQVHLKLKNGQLSYHVELNGKNMTEESPLGLQTNTEDFGHGLTFLGKEERVISEQYHEAKIKQSDVHYKANEIIYHLQNADEAKIDLILHVSNNNVAFRYLIHANGETQNAVVQREYTGFRFPSHTTTFLSPQATPMIGWMRTKPSYEEEYIADEPIGTPSKYGKGYVFPGLFHVGEDGWVLVSETGVTGAYCASKLSEGSQDGLYTVAFPEQEENNGIGTAEPAMVLPGYTPWRTLTVGQTLKPIVETTIPFDVVKPLYEATQEYQFGRSTWSWIMWQDASINYDDQKTFVDLAASLGYEFTLVDANWDREIGYERMSELATYAASQDVGLFLWYNSNGVLNNAPQTPKDRMDRVKARREEMAWMQKTGIKGIKVDFFGGDKQATMQLYEDILTDANDFGLMVIFHGCTLPRGWERMYPNFVGSEAVLASENLIFTQHANDTEAYNATLHPFIRNAVGSMDFGPVLLNKRHNRNNDGGQTRRTSDVFQAATAVAFQTPVQNFGLAPNNLDDVPAHIMDFMKQVPTVWDETVYLAGYPGKYCIFARRHGADWYVVGMNAELSEKEVTVSLDMLQEDQGWLYVDQAGNKSIRKEIRLNKNKKVKLTMPAQGGVILYGK